MAGPADAILHLFARSGDMTMAATMQSLGIDRLSVEEKLTLVREIWDSLVAASARPALSEEQLQELRRRVAEDEADPDALIPWEEVKAQALRRVSP
jgi:putative addiction module component (TIGR02574 family)